MRRVKRKRRPLKITREFPVGRPFTLWTVPAKVYSPCPNSPPMGSCVAGTVRISTGFRDSVYETCGWCGGKGYIDIFLPLGK
jgi:hypothetical protein